MERDFKKELSNFESVWKRVAENKNEQEKGIKLMPGKKKKAHGAGLAPPGRRY